ncbi:MAG: glycosyltransferase, partial [Treponema sp.]|nr:glycosyltransferase [Treponema sp.]
LVLHIGRFVEQKNHSFLIDIFYNLLKEKKDAKLLLVGEGPLKTVIEKKVYALGIQNSVIFSGIRSDIPEIMNASDCFLFPSLFEGFGIVAIEAQVKIPRIVVSDVLPDVVSCSDAIHFVSLNDPIDKWVNSILYGQNDSFNVNNSLEKFDIKTVVDSLESFYAK